MHVRSQKAKAVTTLSGLMKTLLYRMVTNACYVFLYYNFATVLPCISFAKCSIWYGPDCERLSLCDIG